jgi:hypothetical protein
MSKRRMATAVAVVAIAGMGLAAGALATHQGFQGIFNSRGTIDEFKIKEPAMKLKLKAGEPIDIAIVAARILPHGQTGWHSHPADSLVTVRPGGPALTMLEVRDARCVERTFAPGQALVHPATPHNFVNRDEAAPLEFGVAYFVPVGAPLVKTEPAPAECS